MSEENSDLEMIPGITIPLAKIVPTTTSIDGTFPVKRCSSRKRAAPDFFVPTHFRSSRQLHSPAGLRRGPGRPSKQRSDGDRAILLMFLFFAYMHMLFVMFRRSRYFAAVTVLCMFA
ncbi:hypothetical protein CQW23_00261 [Capsicum baccatum]|uniref:Uncharacterized protein n=1 Tax=Capsicum baccatum TaxID=33114 RepID=A0A2G2XK80_CAPBA|nr:hypothetical protein CQW23_00261 [Capsicum baccatum]